MTERPTTIERAFALAASGHVNTVVEIRQALRGEGYLKRDTFTAFLSSDRLQKQSLTRQGMAGLIRVATGL